MKEKEIASTAGKALCLVLSQVYLTVIFTSGYRLFLQPIGAFPLPKGTTLGLLAMFWIACFFRRLITDGFADSVYSKMPDWDDVIMAGFIIPTMIWFFMMEVAT